MSKFHKPEKNPDMNPVDYWNKYGTWEETFLSKAIIKENGEVHAYKDDYSIVSFIIKGEFIEVVGLNSYSFTEGVTYTRFMTLCKFQFQNYYRSAISWIEFTKLNKEIPYIRIGTDYFKKITKKDRYGVERVTLKAWKKEEIKLDHGPGLLKIIHQFDDFCIVPDNKQHQIAVNGCYNMYAPFAHKPAEVEVSEEHIPVSFDLMKHIFGDQLELGLKYMKILYEMPRQALPILCLVSTERQTGKTTFLNWLSMIFGDNYTMINPQDLESSFNSMYANKNIIAIDETVIDKSHATEKLKSIATSKMISVNQKHVANFMLPFFGKIVICTNKETDFARIDEDEIRFWIRKIHTINNINTKIEDQLLEEIPYFLKYLTQLPEIDTTKSRMVFTPDEIENENLKLVKTESWSWLKKELHILISDYFSKNDLTTSIEMAPIDIKRLFFVTNNNVTAGYITKVLRDEMNMKPVDKVIKYSPPIIEYSSNSEGSKSKPGKPYIFYRKDFVDFDEKTVEIEEYEEPF